MIENYVNLSNKESVFDFYGIDHYIYYKPFGISWILLRPRLL